MQNSKNVENLTEASEHDRSALQTVAHVSEMSSENNRNFEALKQEPEKYKISSGGEKEKVLMIDDDATHLEMTKTFLSAAYDVVKVKSIKKRWGCFTRVLPRILFY